MRLPKALDIYKRLNQISPTNGYLPRALLATVEAFGEAVGAVRELEHEARL